MSYLDQITVDSTTYDLQDSGAQRATLTGSTAPTTSTVGVVGQHYINTSATGHPYEYVCTNVSSGTYTWIPVDASDAPVTSVNNKTGAVTLTASDVGALPDSTSIPAPSNATPAALGTASAGSSTSWSRGDHVHPMPPILSSTPPAETSTVSDCLAYAQSNPDKIFCWARYNAATYTPGGVSANWVYTLYTTYTASANYVVFEAQNNTSGEMYRAKSDGTWADLTDHLPAVTTVSLPLSWIDSGSGYYTVTPTVSGETITARSKVNIQPTAAQSIQLQSDGVTSLYIENNAGTLTAYAVGNAPSVALTMQCTVETTDAVSNVIGDAVGGGSAQWKLLWQNPSETSQFAAQTITIDLSAYGALIVMLRNETGSDSGWNISNIVIKGRPTEGIVITGNNRLVRRIIAMSDTGVTFNNAERYNSYGTATTDNSAAIPARIYGIKGFN